MRACVRACVCVCVCLCACVRAYVYVCVRVMAVAAAVVVVVGVGLAAGSMAVEQSLLAYPITNPNVINNTKLFTVMESRARAGASYVCPFVYTHARTGARVRSDCPPRLQVFCE